MHTADTVHDSQTTPAAQSSEAETKRRLEIIRLCEEAAIPDRIASEWLEHGTSVDQVLRELPICMLSPREFEVIRCMCDGLMPEAIARKLDLSVKTVSTYRARLFEKLPHVRNNVQLGIWAERVGLSKDIKIAPTR